jgi:hypothetical protein
MATGAALPPLHVNSTGQEAQTVLEVMQEPVLYVPAAQTLHAVQEAALEVVE